MRVYTVDHYRNRGIRVCIVTDASPWGLGAVLLADNRPIAWIASAISAEDVDAFGFKIGDCAGQQTWECLAMLIASRHWHMFWMTRRVVLVCRADNVSVLTLVAAMKAKGKGPNIIARELALDVASAVFRPNVVAHIPGTSNVIADCLSRRFSPECAFELPSLLVNIAESHPCRRNRSFYRSIQ